MNKNLIITVALLAATALCKAAGIPMADGIVKAPKVVLQLTPEQKVDIAADIEYRKKQLIPGFPSIRLTPDQQELIRQATGTSVDSLSIWQRMDAELECTCEASNIGVSVSGDTVDVPLFLIREVLNK